MFSRKRLSLFIGIKMKVNKFLYWFINAKLVEANPKSFLFNDTEARSTNLLLPDSP